MGEFTQLDNPKVKDLVALLLKLDQEKDIRIEDADTNWEISIIHFSEQENKIFMSGEYYEMGET